MKKLIYFIKEYVLPFVITALSVFLVIKFVFMPIQVVGSSMYPSLNDEDRGFSFVLPRIFRINPKRFSIVVIDADPTKDYIVKRVIGLPGETIEYKDNKLYIDGVYYEEEFLGDVNTNDFSISLAEDEYYCLGDNRDISLDSRFYGPFNIDDFKSYGILVLYPFYNFGVK